MDACAHRPKVLVLSDDDLLCRVIDLALSDCDVARASLGAAPGGVHGAAQREPYDLIVLALGASPVEPLVALARTALLGCVGQVPLLIISNRRLDPDPEDSIYGLGFPFDVHELAGQVHRIVRRGEATGGGGGERVSEGMP